MSATASWRSAGRPLGLLILLTATIRFAPDLLRRRTPPDDCERAAQSSLAVMERCVAQRADDVELLLAFGQRLEASGDATRALAVYRQAAAIDPRDGGVRFRLGAALLARGDRAGARTEARKALTVQPNSPAAIDLARRADPFPGATSAQGTVK